MSCEFKPPRKSQVFIRQTRHGRWSVKCRHGWELTDDLAFAHVLYDAAWNQGEK